MPYCAILQCKNDSRRRNLSNGGISYHRFPKDATIKEKWIDATGRVDWMPSKSTTICSAHFVEDDFTISKNGLRYTKPTAIPTSRVVIFFNEQQNTNSDSSKRRDLPNSQSTPPKKKSRVSSEGFEFEQQDKIPMHSVTCENRVASFKKLKGQIRFCEEKIKCQSLKIKRLQSINRRLKGQISKIEELLDSLEEKFCLKKTLIS